MTSTSLGFANTAYPLASAILVYESQEITVHHHFGPFIRLFPNG
jgi:hypothetical protein